MGQNACRQYASLKFLHCDGATQQVLVKVEQLQGLKWLPAFTSKRRISDYVKEPEVCLGAVARNLFELLPDANFWLNPLSECQKPIPASEVALLLNGRLLEIVAEVG